MLCAIETPIARGVTIRGQLSSQPLQGFAFAICEAIYYLRSLRSSPVGRDEVERNDSKLPEKPNVPLAQPHLSQKKAFFFAMLNFPGARSS